jgi:hypothetical protein
VSKKKNKKTHTHLGINLNKEMKYLNNENYKTLKKEIEEVSRRWIHGKKSSMVLA